LDACFGTAEWRDIAYPPTLFGDSVLRKADDVSAELLRLYVGRLKDEFPFVASRRLIRNTRNAPLYYLLWAGPNERGYKIANDVFQPLQKFAGLKRQKAPPATSANARFAPLGEWRGSA